MDDWAILVSKSHENVAKMWECSIYSFFKDFKDIYFQVLLIKSLFKRYWDNCAILRVRPNGK